MGTDGDAIDDGVGDWGATDPSPKARLVAKSMHLVLDEGDISAIDEYHAADLTYSRSSGDVGDRAALKDDARRFLRAFPDLDVHIHDAFADDSDPDVVTVRYEIEGTHAGTFEGIPPTDQRINAQGIGIAVFEDDTIVEFDLVFDNLGVLQHLGLLT